MVLERPDRLYQKICSTGQYFWTTTEATLRDYLAALKDKRPFGTFHTYVDSQERRKGPPKHHLVFKPADSTKEIARLDIDSLNRSTHAYLASGLMNGHEMPGIRDIVLE